jgi:hypothetical protein
MPLVLIEMPSYCIKYQLVGKKTKGLLFFHHSMGAIYLYFLAQTGNFFGIKNPLQTSSNF